MYVHYLSLIVIIYTYHLLLIQVVDEHTCLPIQHSLHVLQIIIIIITL